MEALHSTEVKWAEITRKLNSNLYRKSFRLMNFSSFLVFLTNQGNTASLLGSQVRRIVKAGVSEKIT
jgi:hypothetical protein